jgi:hypothetical protein
MICELGQCAMLGTKMLALVQRLVDLHIRINGVTESGTMLERWANEFIEMLGML